MYCKKCGNNILDNCTQCPYCGESFSQSPIMPGTFQSGVVQSESVLGKTAGALKGIPVRIIAKLLFLAAILCFAFPFTTVSCSGGNMYKEYSQDNNDYNLSVTYKGYNFIFPSTIDDDNKSLGSGFSEMSGSYGDEDNDDFDASDEDTNGWLVAVVVSCAVGIVLLFIKKQNWAPIAAAVCSLFGIVCLLIFKSNFTERYLNLDKDTQILDSLLDIKYRYGFILCMLCIILSLIASLLVWIKEKYSSGNQL